MGGLGPRGVDSRDLLDAARFQKPGKRSKPDAADNQMEQGWSRERQRVTRVAASQTKCKLEGSQCVLRNRRRYPRPRSGKRLTLRSSLLRLGRDLGARICGCADGRVTRTRRTGIGDNGRRWTTNVALVKLGGKCTFWESCLDGGEGGLQGLVVGMRMQRASESRAKGPEDRAGTAQRKRRAARQRSCCWWCCFECFV